MKRISILFLIMFIILFCGTAIADPTSLYALFGGQQFRMEGSPSIGSGLCRPGTIVAEDLNGDSYIDVATIGGRNANGISVALGNKDGTFKNQTLFPVGHNPVWMAIEDLNKDNVPDIVTANRNDDNISILLGNGDGTFASQVIYAVGENPNSVDIADLNGDNIPDLVNINNTGSPGYTDSISILLGNGDGTFADPKYINEVEGDLLQISIKDVNNDKFQDLILAGKYSTKISVFLGNGDGTFGSQIISQLGPLTHTSYITIADMNGDRFFDVVTYASGLWVLLGNGDGTFGSYNQNNKYLAGPEYYYSVVINDVNNDSIPDVITAGSGTSVLLGNGDGTLGMYKAIATTSMNGQPACTDINGDNITDLITSNRSFINVLLGNGDGTFGSIKVKKGSRKAAIEDLNGDSIPGIVANYELNGDNNDYISVEIGNGDGTFVSHGTFQACEGGWDTDLKDLNRDNIPDIVTICFYNNEIGVLLGNGDGTFGACNTFAIGDTPGWVEIEDLNQDTIPDVFVYGKNLITVLVGDEDGMFESQNPFYFNYNSVNTVDINGDNFSDLVTVNNKDYISVQLSNLDGILSAKYNFSLNSDRFRFLDLNGDAISDIVRIEDDSISVELGNSDGTFGSKAEFPVGYGPWSMAIADLNGDNIFDVVTANKDSDNISVLMGIGNGKFMEQQLFPGVDTDSSTRSIVLEDLNGDNMPDVVTESFVILNQLIGAPAPDIKANGSDGPLNIALTGDLSITIDLSSGGFEGENADWVAG